MKDSDRIRRAIKALDDITADGNSPLCMGLIADARHLLVRARDENAYEEKEAEAYQRDHRDDMKASEEAEARGYVAPDA